MQTTLRINDSIYHRAKVKSSELGLSLTRFFEEAVEAHLTRQEIQHTTGKTILPVSSVSGPMLDDGELRRRIEAADTADDLQKLN